MGVGYSKERYSKIPGHISTSELHKYNICRFAHSSRKILPLKLNAPNIHRSVCCSVLVKKEFIFTNKKLGNLDYSMVSTKNVWIIQTLMLDCAAVVMMG